MAGGGLVLVSGDSLERGLGPGAVDHDRGALQLGQVPEQGSGQVPVGVALGDVHGETHGVVGEVLLDERLGGEHGLGVDLVGLFDQFLGVVVEDLVPGGDGHDRGASGVGAGLDVAALGEVSGQERVVVGVADAADEVPGVDRMDASGVARELGGRAGGLDRGGLDRDRDAQLGGVVLGGLSGGVGDHLQVDAQGDRVADVGVPAPAGQRPLLESQEADSDATVLVDDGLLAVVLDGSERGPDQEPGEQPGGLGGSGDVGAEPGQVHRTDETGLPGLQGDLSARVGGANVAPLADAGRR